MKETGYETRQTSKEHVIVMVFAWSRGIDPAQSPPLTMYKHQWNTKWTFVPALHIFTRENNMLSPHAKRARLLW